MIDMRSELKQQAQNYLRQFGLFQLVPNHEVWADAMDNMLTPKHIRIHGIDKLFPIKIQPSKYFDLGSENHILSDLEIKIDKSVPKQNKVGRESYLIEISDRHGLVLTLELWDIDRSAGTYGWAVEDFFPLSKLEKEKILLIAILSARVKQYAES